MADGTVRALVVDSANPEFFIAHADAAMILSLPREPLAEPEEELMAAFHPMLG